jgi:hypothetical protein
MFSNAQIQPSGNLYVIVTSNSGGKTVYMGEGGSQTDHIDKAKTFVYWVDASNYAWKYGYIITN